jgi:hypothetical protein
MGGRQLLGLVMLVGGLALVGVGAAGLTGALGGRAAVPSESPVATQPQSTPTAPASTAAATSSPAPSAVPTVVAPTVAPTEHAEALIRAFFGRLETAVRDGNQESVAANLGGATVDRYGISTCEAYLASRDPSPEQRFEILSVSGPAPWDYVTDGLTTTVPDAWTVAARVTGPNASGEILTRDAELHVQVGDGMVFWFTDCGEPLPQ